MNVKPLKKIEPVYQDLEGIVRYLLVVRVCLYHDGKRLMCLVCYVHYSAPVLFSSHSISPYIF